MENWRDAPGFSGYRVSDLGRVIGPSGAVLAQRLDKDGYPKLNMGPKRARATVRVHRLILEAFVGPRPDGAECRHLDGNPANNRLENLAWGTSAENKADQRRHGTVPRRKLSDSAVQLVRDFTGTAAEIGHMFGISEGHARNIRSGRRWQGANSVVCGG